LCPPSLTVPAIALATLRQRHIEIHTRAAVQLQKSVELQVRSERLQRRGRVPFVKAHDRFVTSDPSIRPPTLRCTTCGQALVDKYSHIGGERELIGTSDKRDYPSRLPLSSGIKSL
jgi:hypothetical protein